jgi:NADPH-dependent 2,4-dienoyl-CoA reductase/sulfur reductase-like enzyme
MNHVIIGLGAAGRAALTQIHKFEPSSKITVISEEADPFYSRPYIGQMLIDPEVGKADKSVEDNLRHVKDVEFRLSTRATRVDAKGNAVELSDGTKINYNFLLIASGTRFWPQEFGLEGVHTFMLKTRADALRLKRESKDAKAVLVYGGGYQALELSRTFHGLGKKVRWIAPPGFFWPRQLPYITAAQVKEKVDKAGLDLRLDRHVVNVVDLDGRRYLVTDDAGENFECDLILLAPHEVPRLDFLVGSGVHLDRGVIVNEELRTNIPNIFAAGDCAQVHDLNSGQSVINFGWKSATRQGMVAGENMAGHDSVIIPSQDEYVLDLLGKKLVERW